MELINKVESVSRVKNTDRVAAEHKNSSSESFEQMLAFEQGKRGRTKGFCDRPVSVDPDVMNGRMNGYNKSAKEAYFSMVFSTMDLKG